MLHHISGNFLTAPRILVPHVVLLVDVTRSFQANGNVDQSRTRLLDMCIEVAVARFKVPIQEFSFKIRKTQD